MQEKRPTHDQSLKIIQEMIGMARNKITDTGFHFLWWGTLVITASLTQYFMIRFGLAQESFWVWTAMPVLGVPVTLMYESHKKEMDSTRTRFDKIYLLLWLGFGITVAVAIFVSIAFDTSPIAFIMLLMGLATFVSGAIYRFPLLMVGAAIFWLSAIICTLVDFPDQLLINAMAIFAGYIVPGLVLRNKYINADYV